MTKVSRVKLEVVAEKIAQMTGASVDADDWKGQSVIERIIDRATSEPSPNLDEVPMLNPRLFYELPLQSPASIARRGYDRESSRNRGGRDGYVQGRKSDSVGRLGEV